MKVGTHKRVGVYFFLTSAATKNCSAPFLCFVQQLAEHLANDLGISFSLGLFHHLAHPGMEGILVAALVVLHHLLALVQNLLRHGPQHLGIADLLESLGLNDRHTVAVLPQAGFSAAECSSLRQQGIIAG